MEGKYLIRKAPGGCSCKYVACDEQGHPCYAIADRKKMNEILNSHLIGSDYTKDIENKPDISDGYGDSNAAKLNYCMLKHNPNRDPIIIGYARVSTYGQSRDGNSLEIQRETLLKKGSLRVFEDVYTGTKIQRKGLDAALGLLRKGDTLMVTKLDRIARSAEKGIALIDELSEKGINLHVLNIGLIDDSTTGRLIRNIMLCFSDFERDLIIERTQEGKERARQREGYHEGNPGIKEWKIRDAMRFMDEGHSYRETEREMHISKSTLIRHRKEWLLKKSNGTEIPGQLKIVDESMRTEEEK